MWFSQFWSHFRGTMHCLPQRLKSMFFKKKIWTERPRRSQLDVFFFGFWFRWFFLRLSGILCGITSSLRIRKNFFDFSWFKLLRALFRFHIIYKKKRKKDSVPGEAWTHNLVSQTLLLYQLSHHVYWYQVTFHTSFYM